MQLCNCATIQPCNWLGASARDIQVPAWALALGHYRAQSKAIEERSLGRLLLCLAKAVSHVKRKRGDQELAAEERNEGRATSRHKASAAWARARGVCGYEMWLLWPRRMLRQERAVADSGHATFPLTGSRESAQVRTSQHEPAFE